MASFMILMSLPETKIGEPCTKATLKELVQTFHSRHRALYGWGDTSLPVVIGLLKLRAIAKRHPLTLKKQPLSGKDPSGALKRQRQAYFKELGGFVETPCYDWSKVRPGQVLTGPAIIEESKTTVIVLPGCEATIDAYENCLVTLPSKQEGIPASRRRR